MGCYIELLSHGLPKNKSAILGPQLLFCRWDMCILLFIKSSLKCQTWLR